LRHNNGIHLDGLQETIKFLVTINSFPTDIGNRHLLNTTALPSDQNVHGL